MNSKPWSTAQGKRVLVTGATGFIGRHSIAPLLARGYQVHALSSRQPPQDSRDVTWHQLDLLDHDAVRSLIATIRPTHLLHFAWSITPNGYAPAKDHYGWVQGTLDLVRQFAEHGGERVVVSGTCAEYDWRFGFCSEQVTPLAPASFYGVCKNATRAVCEGYAQDEGVSLAWGRVFFVYGPHQPLPRLVPSIISTLLKGEVALCKYGSYIRDYLHVADVADAFVTLLDATDIRGAVNIASGQPVTLKDIAEQIARRLNATHLLEVRDDTSPCADPPLLTADVGRLSQSTGWRPARDLDRGIANTVAWYEHFLRSGAPSRLRLG